MRKFYKTKLSCKYCIRNEMILFTVLTVWYQQCIFKASNCIRHGIFKKDQPLIYCQEEIFFCN